ncbi:hypothetical protein IV203_026026 [Nitzschia inconspicua]|uniref:Uncharacterized protein n=1 Tax=Nitzschia inconspicua TaxID=303405 RepID=A0A9K3PX62_9STRA|nr:hypothetical protein IV203_026026 [Nitzschia inconspicua]
MTPSFSGLRRRVMLFACCGIILVVQFFHLQNGLPNELTETMEICCLNSDHHSNTTATTLSISKFPTAHFPPPTVVILPGPHKAGSTSLQYCMVDWTHNYVSEKQMKRQIWKIRRWKKIQKRQQRKRKERGKEYPEAEMTSSLGKEPPLEPLVLPGWAWPIPLAKELNDTNLMHVTPQKGFASLMATINDDPGMTKKGLPLTSQQKNSVMKMFQAAMMQAWLEGYKIVFGSEEFDRVAYPRNSNKTGTEMLASLLDILPWEFVIHKQNNESKAENTTDRRPPLRQQDLEAVIVYRAPRIHHLKSLWHQVGGLNQTFAEFIRSEDEYHAFDNFAGVLDTMALAHQFVEFGIRTTVIDMSGIANMDTNVCHILVCDVMRDTECNENKMIASLVNKTFNVSGEERRTIDISTRIWNQRPDDTSRIDLTSLQLEAIEKILREYDCGWRKRLILEEGFRILYQHSLFSDCEGDSPLRSLSWMVGEIQKIAGASVEK